MNRDLILEGTGQERLLKDHDFSCDVLQTVDVKQLLELHSNATIHSQKFNMDVIWIFLVTDGVPWVLIVPL